MEELSSGIEMDENPTESFEDPCSDDKEVCGLFHVHYVLGLYQISWIIQILMSIYSKTQFELLLLYLLINPF